MNSVELNTRLLDLQSRVVTLESKAGITAPESFETPTVRYAPVSLTPEQQQDAIEQAVTANTAKVMAILAEQLKAAGIVLPAVSAAAAPSTSAAAATAAPAAAASTPAPAAAVNAAAPAAPAQ